MLLTELAENLTKYLNDNKTSWDGGSITVKTELDPDKFMLEELGVYVVPLFSLYNADEGRGRAVRQGVIETLYVNLIVSKVFVELPISDGVANWDEAKPIITIRQKAERFLMGWDGTDISSVQQHIALASVDPQPVEELELDNRNFVALTTFGWEQKVCLD